MMMMMMIIIIIIIINFQSANVKVQNILHVRNNITCSTNCKYRTAATLYTVGTWFVSGISFVNTLHKGDNDDDDDALNYTGHYACSGLTITARKSL